MIETKNTDFKEPIPWQFSSFAWIGVVLAFFLLLSVLLIMKLGYEGFKAGEMGAMIGIFAIVGLIFLLPLSIFTILLVIGIFKRKKWAYIASLVYSIITVIAFFSTITISVVLFLIIMLFMGFLIWLNIFCLKYMRNKSVDE